MRLRERPLHHMLEMAWSRRPVPLGPGAKNLGFGCPGPARLAIGPSARRKRISRDAPAEHWPCER